jgi:hypothetical protein
MPLNRPILDDRSYEQLRNELIQRIPVYAPEWTDHNASDPGITLLELFSYLGENLLYRFNQIPETTYLEYLNLLQIPLRPAQPAHALLSLTTEISTGVAVPMGTVAQAGDIKYATQDEVRVLPLSCIAVAKAAQEAPDDSSESDEAIFFQQAYQSIGLASAEDTAPYQSELLSEDGSGAPVNFDEAVDGVLWLAVLAKDSDAVAGVREQLASHNDAPLLMNIGFVPEISLDPGVQDITSPAFEQLFRCPGADSSLPGRAVEWQISTAELDGDGNPVYRPLRIEGDTTIGLQREGIVRLRMPRDVDECGPFTLDIPDMAGTDDFPPLLDDELEARVLFWIRVFRPDQGRFGKVLYVGANCTAVEQTLKARLEFLGTGSGQANQSYPLVNRNVIPDSMVLEVEEADGWQQWTEVSDFFASGESERHYVLDAEAGEVRFGNGLRGYVPQIGQRIRVRRYRYGGGISGNVAAKAIIKLKDVNGVKVSNPLPAYGGADSETIEEALERIPSELRRRDRAVTRDDFQELALQAPGANIGRAECLPRFHPQLPEGTEAAGVVSVIIWPSEDAAHPDAPLPNRQQIQRVCQCLDARRLVTTELYVLAPRYHRIALAVGVKVKPGYGIDAVRHWVELILRQYLAPLPPYGPAGDGWPLGRAVHGPELEAAALQVEGVEYLEGLKVVGWDRDGNFAEDRVSLARDEVPQVISITVEDGPITLDPGEWIEPVEPGRSPVPIPVIREVC